MSQTNSAFDIYVDMSRRMSESIVANMDTKEMIRSLGLTDDVTAKKKLQFYTKQVETYIMNDLQAN